MSYLSKQPNFGDVLNMNPLCKELYECTIPHKFFLFDILDDNDKTNTSIA